jgi:hypothetical protein
MHPMAPSMQVDKPPVPALWPALAVAALGPLAGVLAAAWGPWAVVLCCATSLGLASMLGGMFRAPTPSVTSPAPCPLTPHTSQAENQAAADLAVEPDLKALLTEVLPAWIRHVEAARTHAQQGMDNLAISFATLSAGLEPPVNEAAAQHLVEQILVDLQSQDRMGQMLGCVTEDMQRLKQWFDSGQVPTAASTPAAWLAQLASTYPMEDMLAEHPDNKTVEKSTSVEYF